MQVGDDISTRLLPIDAASDFAPTARGSPGGPVQARWCYPIERCLKLLQKNCRNKAKIEASVAEAFRVEEVSNFTKAYYAENPTPRYNEEWSSSTLSLFKGQLGRGSTATCKTLQQHEFRTIMIYVLLNLDKVVPYRT